MNNWSMRQVSLFALVAARRPAYAPTLVIVGAVLPTLEPEKLEPSSTPLP